MIKKIEMKAPAKINLGLNILEKRNDGYHNIDTLFYPINDLFDLLYFEHSEKLEFESNIPDLDKDPSNLILKAVKLLENKTNNKFNVKIKLIKNIPIGAGLGGGSSDAAATLLSLNDMFRLKYKFTDLQQLAIELGSDVPFFITAKPAIGESRGEKLTPLDFNIKHPILIVNPGIHISTAEAYKNCKPNSSNIPIKEFITKNSLKNFGNLLKNDFENYVFDRYPEIKKIKETMLNNNALFSLMSGSGSTVFGIFENIELCKKMIERFPDKYLRIITNSE